MKRLLVPLIAAIALPTAVNAFPFWNDVQTENNVWEKILVKGSTINVQPLYAKDLKNNIEKTIKRFESYANKEKEYVKDLENSLAIANKNLLASKRESVNKENSKGYRAYFKDVKIPEWTNRVYEYENKVLEAKKSIEPYTNAINLATNDLFGLKDSSNIIHKNKIYFKPILIDLNGQKTVQPERSTLCLNPKLDSKLVGLWNKYKFPSEEYLELEELNKKICTKYAKF